eukprot:Skav236309  [mRNA]  locus=scaffold97:54492:56478:+ [translate_table: standard]
MIRALRSSHNGEVLLAEHLRQEAAQERRQWEDMQPELQDGRFIVLSAMIIQAPCKSEDPVPIDYLDCMEEDRKFKKGGDNDLSNGPVTKRGCTDLWCLIVLLVAWLAYVVVTLLGELSTLQLGHGL